MKISARNQLPGRVEQITRGGATSVSVASMSMTAAITVEALEALGIKVGSDVIVIVKASDVMLAVE